jgi:hypothetical protein
MGSYRLPIIQMNVSHKALIALDQFSGYQVLLKFHFIPLYLVWGN